MNFNHNLKQILWTVWITEEYCLYALKTGMHPRDTPVTSSTSKALSKLLACHSLAGRTLFLFPRRGLTKIPIWNRKRNADKTLLGRQSTGHLAYFTSSQKDFDLFPPCHAPRPPTPGFPLFSLLGYFPRKTQQSAWFRTTVFWAALSTQAGKLLCWGSPTLFQCITIYFQILRMEWFKKIFLVSDFLFTGKKPVSSW